MMSIYIRQYLEQVFCVLMYLLRNVSKRKRLTHGNVFL